MTCQAFRRRRSLARPVAGPAEDGPQDLADDEAVVHDEDRVHDASAGITTAKRHPLRRGRSRPEAFRRARGCMSPAIARPRPVPPCEAFVEKNGSNARSACSGVYAGGRQPPTTTRPRLLAPARGRACRARQAHGGGAAAASMPFFMRLTSTCTRALRRSPAAEARLREIRREGEPAGGEISSWSETRRPRGRSRRDRGGRGRGVPAREVEEAAHEARRAECLLFDLFRQLAPGIPFRSLLEQDRRAKPATPVSGVFTSCATPAERRQRRPAFLLAQRTFHADGLGGVVQHVHARGAAGGGARETPETETSSTRADPPITVSTRPATGPISRP